MSDTDEPVLLRSMIEVVEKQRNPGQRFIKLEIHIELNFGRTF